MKIKLIQHVGSDQQIADIAGISYDKEMSSAEKLIPFLLKNGHHSPFEHSLLTFYIEVPIYIARQLVRHRIGVSINEMSRRYVDSEPEFDSEGLDPTILDKIKELYLSMCKGGLKMRELARKILPVCTMTKMYVSFNMRSFIHFQKLRNSTHAQAEMKEFAQLLLDEVKKLKEFNITLSNY